MIYDQFLESVRWNQTRAVTILLNQVTVTGTMTMERIKLCTRVVVNAGQAKSPDLAETRT